MFLALLEGPCSAYRCRPGGVTGQLGLAGAVCLPAWLLLQSKLPLCHDFSERSFRDGGSDNAGNKKYIRVHHQIQEVGMRFPGKLGFSISFPGSPYLHSRSETFTLPELPFNYFL